MSATVRTVDDGGTHRLVVTNTARFYSRDGKDGVSVRSVYYRREDWTHALECYAARFPVMVKEFGGNK